MKKLILFILFALIIITRLTAQNISDAPAEFYDAMNAYNSREYIKANRLFEEFFKGYDLKDEIYSTAKYYASDALLNLGHKDAAAAGFEFLVNNFNWSNFRDKSLYKLGLLYFEDKQYYKSRVNLEELLNDHPNSEHTGSALYWIGESYTVEGKYNEAISFLEEAVNKRKDNRFLDYSIFTLASVYEKTGDYESAVKYYDQLLSYHKNSPLAASAQIRIGIAYFKLKDYHSSILELNSPVISGVAQDLYSESLYLLANSYYRVEDYVNAEKTYLEILENFPESDVERDVKYGLAWSYFQQEKYDDAFSYFNSLSDGNDSIGVKSSYWKAEAKRYGGDDEEAFLMYDEFLQKHPDSYLVSGIQYQKGALNYDIKDFEQARRELNKAISSQDRIIRARAFTLLGEIDLNEQKFEQANTNFQSALDILNLPADLRNRAKLGLAASLFYLGNYKEAVRNLVEIETSDRAFEKDKINFYLAENYFALEDYAFALERYNEIDSENNEVGNAALYGKAYCYFNLKDFERAALQFNDYVKKFPKDPKNIDARLRLADSYYGSKNFNAASRVYREFYSVGRGSINTPYAQYQYAQALYKGGNAAEAIKEFSELQSKYPNSEFADRALYIIGWIEFQRGNYSEAIAKYRNVLSSYPNTSIRPVIQYSIGDAYFNISRYDSAISFYQKVLSESPSSNYVFDAVNGIQYSYVAQGQTERAVTTIDEFVSRNPSLSFSDQIFFKKGEIYYSQAQYEQAKTSYKEFIAQYPQSKLVADAYFWIGKSSQNLEQNEEAVFNYNRVFENYPGTEASTGAAIEMGNIYNTLLRFDDALAVLNKAIERVQQSPRAAELLFMKGTTLVNKADFQSAYEVFDEVVVYYGNTLFGDKARFEVGMIELAAKRYENADNQFRTLAEKRTDDLGAKAQYYYGLSQFEQGKYRDAITAFVRVRTIFSAYDEWLARAYIKLGDAYIELEDFNTAKEMYRAVLSKHKGDIFGQEAQTKLRALQ
ncbi:MAG: tetratricopeptide repeat protein [Ignavibacteriaceae bacterium]